MKISPPQRIFGPDPNFSPATRTFMQQLHRHRQDKAWFEKHRPTYEKVLLNPFRHLVQSLEGLMLGIDPYLITTPAIGKTISRIYRDTRFSSDKSLLRSNMWFFFRRPGDKDKEFPGFFFELNTQGFLYGLGAYRNSAGKMALLRQAIQKNLPTFKAALRPIQKTKMVLEGEDYQRQYHDEFAQLPQVQEWFQKKYCYLMASYPWSANIYNPSYLADLIGRDFYACRKIYAFLWMAIRPPTTTLSRPSLKCSK
ncbi:MAG: DUF2461 domain-containing protein [Bacteriovoracaceae bacterium]|nr:DUF2461 domain-containing protein [Bacteriovoracaceae bacterium]